MSADIFSIFIFIYLLILINFFSFSVLILFAFIYFKSVHMPQVVHYLTLSIFVFLPHLKEYLNEVSLLKGF